MDRAGIIGVLLIVGAFVFQVWVTVRVFRSRLYETSQKSAQAKLIWLLPVLGAIIAFSVLSSEEQAERRANDPQLRS